MFYGHPNNRAITSLHRIVAASHLRADRDIYEVAGKINNNNDRLIKQRIVKTRPLISGYDLEYWSEHPELVARAEKFSDTVM